MPVPPLNGWLKYCQIANYFSLQNHYNPEKSTKMPVRSSYVVVLNMDAVDQSDAT